MRVNNKRYVARDVERCTGRFCRSARDGGGHPDSCASAARGAAWRPLGVQRERVGKEAGLRTHMLVALGSAFFVLVPYQAGMSLVDLSRVLQGVIAGIGFLGA